MAKFNPNEYETVADRLRRFKSDWPDSDILTELVEVEGGIGKSRWVVKASVWREKGYERPDSTGYAFEIDGTGMANNSSALENCETSAIGRALANLNYSGDKRATREEMEKVRRYEEQQEQKEAARRQYVAKQTNGLLVAENNKDLATIKKAWDYYGQQGDRELVEIARTTYERMKAAGISMQQAQDNVQEALDAEIVEDDDKGGATASAA